MRGSGRITTQELMDQSPRAPSPGSLQTTITHNLHAVKQTIRDSALRAGRNPDDIRLIAVSKTVPPQAVEAAIAAGQTEFGENTVQDALTKIPIFQDRGLTWHFIGYLQTNKVKFIPARFAWLHSLDRLPLALKLSASADRHGVEINCLVQVNVTGDPNKHGIAQDSVYELIERILEAELKGIRLRGLMTLGPYRADDSALRACFARLRALRDECSARFKLNDFTELSMGMTDDFSIAISEGATMIRIGTAIFGPRPFRES